MSRISLFRNRNFRRLFAAGALTNLGDGVVMLALPWLATLMTDNALLIGLVAAAGRLPWLLFAIPAGVITDRMDRRLLMVRADLARAVIAALILGLALRPAGAGAILMLAALAFLLGTAEVLRDNAAQTLLPAVVEPDDLEAANGRMWSIEQLTGQFLGPPLAGGLIALGIAVPFGLHAAVLMLAAGFVWALRLPPFVPVRAGFWQALVEGLRFMRQDRLLLRLAIVLGIANFIAMATMTVQVLFAQEVLGLSPVAYGIVLSVAAAGAMSGSLGAPRMIAVWGAQACLYLAIAGWGIGYAAVGLTRSPIVMAAALSGVMAAAMLWNVITVSWRQRRIPSGLLGRVNSIYRCFGWGSMPLGALAGGGLVALLEADLGREMAVRAPFLLAGVACFALLIYARLRLRLD